MSNQTIHCHRGILSDDSALAQRMVFVQDELGLLKPLQAADSNIPQGEITIVN